MPTYWLKSMESIISLVSSGRLVRKRIWLGGCSGITAGAACTPPAAASLAATRAAAAAAAL